MKLSAFITANLEEILAEWEEFARTQLPSAGDMGQAELRDHAKQMLEAIVLDLDAPQSGRERDQKAMGLAPEARGDETAAASHGTLREASGFTLLQLTAEFRALRASVLKLWGEAVGELRRDQVADLMRFNEAIDQAVAESVVTYSARAGRSRDTFLAILGHDLRGPLATMVVVGEYLLLPEARTGDLKGAGERVKRNALMMSAMVSDLLEYSRTQLGGSIPVRRQMTDLRAIALAALRDASAVDPKCAFDLQVEGDLVGELDPVRIQQVLTNLLTNAAQYRDKHYPVTLSIVGEIDSLRLLVKNRGPVIPASAFEAIFDPLVQLAQPAEHDERPATSMGLGLFVARQVAEAHGGSIAVTSTEKDGTAFSVTIPRSVRAGA